MKLSQISSIERLHRGTGHGRNHNSRSALTNDPHASMMGSPSFKQFPRARSTINPSKMSTYSPSKVSQANAPFHSSGPRFASVSKQCKWHPSG